MKYINEFASESDVVAWGLNSVNEKYGVISKYYSWTVDYKNRSYLRFLKSGREDEANLRFLVFFWNDCLMEVWLDHEGGGTRKDCWDKWGLISISIPEDYKIEREKILIDLKEALRVYQSLGVLSEELTHVAYFKF